MTHFVCLNGTAEMLAALLEAGAPAFSIAEGASTERTELFIAAARGDCEMIKVLLAKKVNDSHVSSCGVRYGAKMGLDPGNTSEFGSMAGKAGWCYLHAIHMAIINDDAAVVRLLLESNVAETQPASLRRGWIDLAVLHKRESILVILMEHLLAGSPGTVLYQQCVRLDRGSSPARP